MALIGPDTMRRTGGIPAAPICSAFSDSSENSSRPASSSSLTTNRTLPARLPAASVAVVAAKSRDSPQQSTQSMRLLALDEVLELRAGDVVRQLLRRALHQVGRRGHHRAADAAVLGY